MYSLSEFSLADMTRCGSELRKVGENASSMEQVADKIVRFLYDRVVEEDTGARRLSLVRLFKTHPYEDLDPEPKRFAVDALGHEPEVSSTKCLTLLATTGVKDEWNSRLLSKHHKTIPLPIGGANGSPITETFIGPRTDPSGDGLGGRGFLRRCR